MTTVYAIGSRTTGHVTPYKQNCPAVATSEVPKDSKKNIFFTYSGDNQTFQSGYLGITESSIRGTLHIRFKKNNPFYAKNISIILTCVERGNLSLGGKRNKKTYTCFLTTVDQRKEVWRSETPDGFQLIDEMDIPFEFKLPNNVNGSLVTSSSHIKYNLKAIVYRKAKWYQSSEKSVSIDFPVYRYIFPMPDLLQPGCFKVEPNDNKTKTKIDCSLLLPKIYFSPNEEIPFQLKVKFPDPRVSIKSIQFGLKTCADITFSTTRSPFFATYYSSKKRVKVNEIRMLPDSNNTDVTIELKIPVNEDVISTTNSSITKISHKVRAKVALSGDKDFEIEVPVIISRRTSPEVHDQILRIQSLMNVLQ
ncbi:hypothetical protein G9A89_002124 [Geosiphon pyriformis]|nr:hypothetical protein G9A89_002124 [Geosiphon pyriformis]